LFVCAPSADKTFKKLSLSSSYFFLTVPMIRMKANNRDVIGENVFVVMMETSLWLMMKS